jgi:DNA-binding MarR family transcriptional regulator
LVTNLYDEALRPFELRVSQLNLLAAAAAGEATRPAELCRRLDLDPSTLSRNLQILRRRGWIEFLEDSGDARAQPFRVTARGRDLIDSAHAAWRLAQQQAELLLGAETLAALSRSTSMPRSAKERS